MNHLYNAGIRLYRQAARLAATRSPKVKRMLRGQRETFRRLKAFRMKLAPAGFDVWFHVASLGEFEQARPLIEAILAEKPELHILVSFFSPSGYDVRCHYNPKVAVVYLPFDLPDLVSDFLDVANPKMAIFVKYEFWGNYLGELHRRGIPVYIISAIFRKNQVFFKPWGSMFRRMLSCFNYLYVQDENSRKLLEGIGVSGNVAVVGDTRFDRVMSIRQSESRNEPVETFISASQSGRKPFVLVIGSSWEADEDVYIPWLEAHTDVKAVIAPHEFDADRLYRLRSRLGSDVTMLLSDFVRLCETDPVVARARAASLRVLIVDCYGLLSTLYRYADVAYVGGGFGTGIHNINEAAVFGCPVVFGPKHRKFNEARDLIACGGAFSIDGPKTFARRMNLFLNSPEALVEAGRAAGSYIKSNVGATPRILHDLFDI